MSESIDGGILLGDLSYRGPKLSQLLADESELLMLTRFDAAAKRELISGVRQRIESMLSQFWRNFIDRILSRSAVAYLRSASA